MKRNTRNLVVLTIITVIVPFMLAACATTSPSAPQAIKGQYAGVGEGRCVIAPLGFKPNLTPSCIQTPQGTTVCPSITNSWTGDAVFSFNKDGTGSLTSLVQFVTDSFKGPSGLVPSSAGAQKVSAKLHYNVTNEGKITITADPGTYTSEWISGPSVKKTYHMNGWARKGTVTLDGKMIMLNSLVADVMSFIPPLVDLPPTAQGTCNGTNVLIWQHD
jgi:hypothetical protein